MPTSAILVIACALGAAGGPRDPWCQQHLEEFSSFAGPPSIEGDLIQAKWCLSGAAVATGGFCQTGPALKLDSSSEDPVLWVRSLHPDCSTIILSFTYSQFASTGTTLRRVVTTDTSLNCAKSVSTGVIALNATGVCNTIVDIVSIAPGQSIYWKFDHGTPSSNAIFIDSLSIDVGGCCSAHDCCTTGGPGCEDDAVSLCVCELDPYCCDVEWDQTCVDEVVAFDCGECGPPTDDCITAFATNFGDNFTGLSVCTTLADLFETCEGSTPYVSGSTACGGLLDMALRFGPGFPYSAAITRCIDLSSIPDPQLTFSFTKNSGTLGPRIDVSVGDERFQTLWSAPIQFSGSCQTQTIDLAEFAAAGPIRLRFASGSSVSNGASFDDVAIEAAPRAHDCCTLGAAGCETTSIESCVCAIDPFCCSTQWDAACVQEAVECGADCGDVPTCGQPSAGACLRAHSTPFCDDADCCVSICFIDPFCCEEQWDELCAEEAFSVCAGGACLAGACQQPQAAAGCTDLDCCTNVCLFDPFCCLAAWDDTCVAEAAQLCSSTVLVGDLNADSSVDGADLGLLLAAWGTGGGPADLTIDGTVDGADLGILLSNWSS